MKKLSHNRRFRKSKGFLIDFKKTWHFPIIKASKWKLDVVTKIEKFLKNNKIKFKKKKKTCNKKLIKMETKNEIKIEKSFRMKNDD